MRLKVIRGIVLAVLLTGMSTLAFNGGKEYVLAHGAWTIESVDTADDVGWDTSIALDGDDKPHISYYEWAVGFVVKRVCKENLQWISQE